MIKFNKSSNVNCVTLEKIASEFLKKGVKKLKENFTLCKKINFLIIMLFAFVFAQATLLAGDRMILTEPETSETMLTVWSIPSNNTTIKLPIEGNININIDWGDGTTSGDVTTAFPEHTYNTSGDYTIKIRGNIGTWGYRGDSRSIPTTSNYYTYTEYLTKVKQFGELGATSYGFSECKNLTEVSGENLVTEKTFENVTDMSYMFRSCTSLEKVKSTNWDLSNVTNMEYMFAYCNNLNIVDVSNWDVSNVTKMGVMFHTNKKLLELDVSKWNTSSVEEINHMFYDCEGLTTLDISNWNTSNVKKINYTFANCENLTKLDVSKWDTSNVESMDCIFEGLKNLIYLDLSNWDIRNAEGLWLFNGCSNLKAILLSNKFIFKELNYVDEYGMEVLKGLPKSTAIVFVNETPVVNQLKYVKEGLNGNIIYVPNSAESAYEEAWKDDFSADRIEPILELTEGKNINAILGEKYIAPGYTVAGINENILNVYKASGEKILGYNVEIVGDVSKNPDGTIASGTHQIEYILTRTYKSGDAFWGKDSNGNITVDESQIKTTTYEVARITATIKTVKGITDVEPPTGEIKVRNAILKNNVNYVTNTNVTIEIYAEDNISNASDIKFYITDEKIDSTSKIPNSKWEDYKEGIEKNITLKNLLESTIIYAIFKDGAGNISTTFTGVNMECNIIYNLNGGTGEIENMVATCGLPIVLTKKVPTNGEKYFLGWSTSNTATSAEYKRGEIMSASAINGKTRLNLYAVWGERPLLADVAKINDIIEYPIYYSDLSGNNKTSWKVKDIVKDRTTDEKYVEIISTGVPLKLNNTSTDLTNNFFNITNYKENGFVSGSELERLFFNKHSKLLDDVVKVKGEKDGENVYVVVTLKTETKATGINDYDAWQIENELDKVTVLFNANGGVLDETSKQVVYYSTYGKLPEPTKEGFVFLGWYTTLETGTKISENTIVDRPNGTITLYARWEYAEYDITYDLDTGLPLEYTQLEYIISSGSQYINTGFIPNGNTKIEIDFRNMSTAFLALFGARIAENNSVFGTWIDGSKIHPHYGNTYYNTQKSLEFNTYNRRIKYTLDAGLATAEGLTSNGTKASFDSTYNLTLLAMMSGGKLDYRTAVVWLYGAKIYDDGILVRNFIPAKNPEGVVGLYDAVEGKFYAGSGSERFAAGEEAKSKTYATKYRPSSGDITLPQPERIGYNFIGWTGSNGTTPEKNVILKSGSMGNKHYKANWKRKSYTVTATAGEGGMITPASAVVNYGEDCTFNIVANTGYRVSQLLIDGEVATNAYTHTFKDVKENHTIDVSFKESQEYEFSLTDTLESGKRYIIASGTDAMTVLTELNPYRAPRGTLGVATVAINDGVIITKNSDIIWKYKDGGLFNYCDTDFSNKYDNNYTEDYNAKTT